MSRSFPPSPGENLVVCRGNGGKVETVGIEPTKDAPRELPGIRSPFPLQNDRIRGASRWGGTADTARPRHRRSSFDAG